MDGYDVLGLAPGANERQVRLAYLRLARLHHPDQQPAGRRDAAMRRMQLINVAREQVLQDVRERVGTRPAPATPERERPRLVNQHQGASAATMSEAALRRQRIARAQQLRRQREERLRWAARQVELAQAERDRAPDPGRVVATTWAGRLVARALTVLVLASSLVFGTSIGLWLGAATDNATRVVFDGDTWALVAQPAAVAGVVLMSLVASLRVGWVCARNLWR